MRRGRADGGWGRDADVPPSALHSPPSRLQESRHGMQAFIISDHEPTAVKVRQALLRQGHDCPAGHVAALDLALDRLAQTRPGLVVVVLSPDPERGLTVLN